MIKGKDYTRFCPFKEWTTIVIYRSDNSRRNLDWWSTVAGICLSRLPLSAISGSGY